MSLAIVCSYYSAHNVTIQLVTTVHTMSLYSQLLQYTQCHYIASYYSTHNVTIQLVTTVHTMSLYSQLLQCTQCHYIASYYSAHNVTIQLVTTVRTMSLALSYIASYCSAVSQLQQCKLCHYMQLVTQLYTTVYTVSLNMHNITMDSQLAVQPDYLSQLATVCTMTLHLCTYSAYSIIMHVPCMYITVHTKCHNVQQCSYIAMLLQLVIAILQCIVSLCMQIPRSLSLYVATVYTGTLQLHYIASYRYSQ